MIYVMMVTILSELTYTYHSRIDLGCMKKKHRRYEIAKHHPIKRGFSFMTKHEYFSSDIA